MINSKLESVLQGAKQIKLDFLEIYSHCLPETTTTVKQDRLFLFSKFKQDNGHTPMAMICFNHLPPSDLDKLNNQIILLIPINLLLPI